MAWRIGYAVWRDSTGDAHFKFSPEYKTADPLMQCDAIKDLLEALNEEYVRACERFSNDLQERMDKAKS